MTYDIKAKFRRILWLGPLLAVSLSACGESEILPRRAVTENSGGREISNSDEYNENDPEQSDDPAQSPSQSDIILSLEDVSYTGEGCSSENTAVTLSGDGEAITFVFAELFTEISNTQISSEKTCSIQISMRASQKIVWHLLRADQRGFIRLDDNVEATLSQTIHLNDASRTKQLEVNGFFDDDVIWSTEENELPKSSLCSDVHTIEISLQLLLVGPEDQEGLIVIDSSDALWQNQVQTELELCQ